MMNKKLKEIAEQAGFVLFTPEEDPRTPIDWSCDYEQELQEFARLIVDNAVECVRDVVRDEGSDLTWDACSQVQNRIREYFEIKNVDSPHQLKILKES